MPTKLKLVTWAGVMSSRSINFCALLSWGSSTPAKIISFPFDSEEYGRPRTESNVAHTAPGGNHNSAERQTLELMGTVVDYVCLDDRKQPKVIALTDIHGVYSLTVGN